MRLLAAGGEGNSSFFAQEIVGSDAAVAPTLISFRGSNTDDLAKCTLGLELLAHFIAEQSTSEFAKSIGNHVVSRCERATPAAAATERAACTASITR